MTKKLKKFFKDKSVLILGFGMEGRSTLKLLRNFNVLKIGIADIKPPENTEELSGCEIYTGEDYLLAIEKYDIVMKAPGVALFNRLNAEQKEKITSQTDLFLRFCESTVIGVTGTKGKSTVASLIFSILSACGKKAALVGNIGVPPFDGICSYDKDAFVVCEMSCHQLEYVKASPDIAVLLNIYEEHLDHYTDFNAYRSAKENIFLYQKKNGVLFISDEIIAEKPILSSSQKIICSLNNKCDVYATENEIVINGILIPKEKIKTFLSGKHNLYNIAVASAVCMNLGCAEKHVLKAAADFKGLPHRLEYICSVNGAEYINDSISTIPRASISAVNAFPDTDSIILGGMDRGIDYGELIDFLESDAHEIKNIIVIPDSGYRIAVGLNKKKQSVFRAADLKEAVEYAVRVTKVRCILSPAAASYGFYKNFEERGEHFKFLVTSIKEK